LRPRLPPAKLGELLTTIAKVGFGDSDEEARDVLGRTYEYFIKTFARHEGHRGGEFYTPASVMKLLVESRAIQWARVRARLRFSGPLHPERPLR
jgi:type I restriction enzyme M protein